MGTIRNKSHKWHTDRFVLWLYTAAYRLLSDGHL